MNEEGVKFTINGVPPRQYVQDELNKVRQGAEKFVGPVKGNLPYAAGAAIGTAMVGAAVLERPEDETLSQKIRRYGQIAIGATIVGLSALGYAYDKNLYGIGDKINKRSGEGINIGPYNFRMGSAVPIVVETPSDV
jgi:hypothetical protein